MVLLIHLKKCLCGTSPCLVKFKGLVWQHPPLPAFQFFFWVCELEEMPETSGMIKGWSFWWVRTIAFLLVHGRCHVLFCLMCISFNQTNKQMGFVPGTNLSVGEWLTLSHVRNPSSGQWAAPAPLIYGALSRSISGKMVTYEFKGTVHKAFLPAQMSLWF